MNAMGLWSGQSIYEYQMPKFVPNDLPKAQAEVAKPLRTWEWDVPASLTIHEATTCNYRATWNVKGSNAHGQWPRTYNFHADGAGWISDHFIQGNRHARVFWNLRTNATRVQGLDGSAVDDATARQMASFAKRTIFPGIDLKALSR